MSDTLPAGFEIGVQCGRVEPDDIAVVTGAGPVGLSAMTFRPGGPFLLP